MKKAKNKNSYYIYVIKCSDMSLYTGYTNDVNARVKTHNDGKGAKAIKGRLPVELVYTEKFDSKSDAMKREAEIKKWDRSKKISELRISI